MYVCEKEEFVSLSAGKPAEEEILHKIVGTKKIGDRLVYQGRFGADCNDPPDRRMNLKFALDGDEIFVLSATADKDEKPIRHLRDAIFFGGGGLIFLGEEESAECFSLKFAVGKCKLCDKPIFSMGECEWKTCNVCKDKCEHDYVKGAVHGGDFGVIGAGFFCQKCGRAKPSDPNERKRSQIEKDLEVQRQLGVTILYKNSPIVTPAQGAQALRIARKLKRSRDRSMRRA